MQHGSVVISSKQTFTDCVVLDTQAFDPDRVFHDDIVDDEVLPSLSLAVDGLTGAGRVSASEWELRPEDAANDSIEPDSTMPEAAYDPEQLEVYGWETSLWRKLLSYIRF